MSSFAVMSVAESRHSPCEIAIKGIFWQSRLVANENVGVLDFDGRVEKLALEVVQEVK